MMFANVNGNRRSLASMRESAMLRVRDIVVEEKFDP